MLLGAFWVPKEDRKSIAAGLITYFKYLDEKRVRLLRLVASFLVDGHEGAKAAIQQARLRCAMQHNVHITPRKTIKARINIGDLDFEQVVFLVGTITFLMLSDECSARCSQKL